MRRCVWSRNLKNEEAMAQFGPQGHRGKKKKKFYVLPTEFVSEVVWITEQTEFTVWIL